MVKHRRALGITLSLVALTCAVIGVLEAFEWAAVPGGRWFALATVPMLFATWLFNDLTARTPPPDEHRR